MKVTRSIRVTVIKGEDGSVVLRDADAVPPGEYQATMVVAEEDDAAARAARRKACEEFLASVRLDLDPGAFPEGCTFRREDMYDDWGRLIGLP